jgi:C_GCAxxG_C_C family probable redox protein
MEPDTELSRLAGSYAEKYGNCAQASFHALVQYLRLPCDVQTFVRALTAMPGVAGTCETCGAVSGSLLAIGIALGPTEPSSGDAANRCLVAANRFCASMVEHFGSTRCGTILERSVGSRYVFSDPAETARWVEAGGPAQCMKVIQTAVQLAAPLIRTAAS